jgi:hypothetical protein
VNLRAGHCNVLRSFKPLLLPQYSHPFPSFGSHKQLILFSILAITFLNLHLHFCSSAADLALGYFAHSITMSYGDDDNEGEYKACTYGDNNEGESTYSQRKSNNGYGDDTIA